MMIFSTKEWSEKSFNICLGCSHMCAYCYAREMVLRFGRIQSPEEWATEQVRSWGFKTSVSMEPALSMPAVAGEFRELSSFAEVI